MLKNSKIDVVKYENDEEIKEILKKFFKSKRIEN